MSLEVLLGPMFAGKSSAILGILRRYKAIQWPTLTLTSSLDKRYSDEAAIVSHDKESFPARAVSSLLSVVLTEEYARARCIVVEEAQFFGDLYDFVVRAVDMDRKNVICVGLDGDSNRKPFGQLLTIIPLADKVEKLTSLCGRCCDGSPAIFTYRKPTESHDSQVLVGGADRFEPLCRKCYLGAP